MHAHYFFSIFYLTFYIKNCFFHQLKKAILKTSNPKMNIVPTLY